MKAIMIMFDSLNRRFLPPYGCEWVSAPNFERLARHTITFDNSYAGSLPCMPARRELHTGRLNFLHRGWSPIEPFDDSMPEILKKNGIHSHLISDHTHYWEDGGATYHTRYSTWEAVRGQEGDPWKCDLTAENTPRTVLNFENAGALRATLQCQDAVNRAYRPDYERCCLKEVFDRGVEFLSTNHKADNWFLQIEAFDPHEPFYTFEEFLDLYEKTDIGRQVDWPPYAPVEVGEDVVKHVRTKYAALVSMCDKNLGRVLDCMDEYNLWEDTMLIVNTDHGYLLGEHGWWAKNVMPTFNEIANTPLFIWDPRCRAADERRKALVQTIDLAPTLLGYFGQQIPEDALGKDLQDTIERDSPVRDYALFGYHGRYINVTDGTYVYMRAPQNPDVQLYEYTLMPNNMSSRMGEVLEKATLSPPFSFSKNMPLLKIPAASRGTKGESLLFDLRTDPDQKTPIYNKAVEAGMINAIAEILRENDAPAELYAWLGV